MKPWNLVFALATALACATPAQAQVPPTAAQTAAYQGLHAAAARGDVVLDHVTFGYLPDQPILKDYSFKVAKGEHVTFVGRTGKGVLNFSWASTSRKKGRSCWMAVRQTIIQRISATSWQFASKGLPWSMGRSKTRSLYMTTRLLLR